MLAIPLRAGSLHRGATTRGVLLQQTFPPSLFVCPRRRLIAVRAFSHPHPVKSLHTEAVWAVRKKIRPAFAVRSSWTGSLRHCSTEASSALVKMASDRDILPDEYVLVSIEVGSYANNAICSVKPTNYAISLFDLQTAEPWTYQGQCDIELHIKKPVTSITLNTHELKLHSASVASESGKHASAIQASDISYDKTNQRCTLSFDQTLPESQKAVLSITFEGTMNNHMVRSPANHTHRSPF